MGPIIELCDVKKSYFHHKVLSGITISLERGRILGLLGPNGSGKSTLLKILAGVAGPTSGKVLIGGRKPSIKTKSSLAYLPERNHLYARMKVKELLEFVSAFYDDWQAAKASELIDRFDIDLSQKVDFLSKGKLSCLKLLLCLARNAPLLLLDEPLSGIDPSSRALIIDAILDNYKAGEQSIVISTHEINAMESIFDEVVFLKEGKIALMGAADDLRQNYHSSIDELWTTIYGT